MLPPAVNINDALRTGIHQMHEFEGSQPTEFYDTIPRIIETLAVTTKAGTDWSKKGI